MAATTLQTASSGSGGRREKPLPALPPARTPSQINHQRQMQLPYRPTAHMRYASAPAVPIAGPSRLPSMEMPRPEVDNPRARPPAPLAPPRASSSQAVPTTAPPAYDDIFCTPARLPPPVGRHVVSSSPAPATPPQVTPAATPSRPLQPLPRAPVTPVSAPPLWRPPSAPYSGSIPSTSTTADSRPRIASPLAPATGGRRVVSAYEPRFQPPPRTTSAQPSSSTSKPTPPPTQHTATPSPHRRVRFHSSPPSSPAARTPTPGKRLSSLASPRASPSASPVSGARGQCWGIKRDGQRCTRIVRLDDDERESSPAARRGGGGQQQQRSKRHTSAPPALAQAQALSLATRIQPICISSDEEDEDDDGGRAKGAGCSDDDDDAPHSSIPTYCHQHAREINKTPGLYVPVGPAPSSNSTTPTGRQQYLPFSTYIPTSLSPLTSAKLRVAMSEPFAPSDVAERGHIYVYELVESDEGRGGRVASSLFKVGRSTRPMARVAQWRKQCESRQAVLRYLSPSSDTTTRATAGLLIGASTAPSLGQRGSHRWEKLVHIELSEVAPRPAPTPHATGASRCADCGKRHREIFEARSGGGGVDVVKEVVERWRRFVEVAVPDEMT